MIVQVPTLKKLDGKEIKHSERIAAQQMLPALEKQLREELIAEGFDPDAEVGASGAL